MRRLPRLGLARVHGRSMEPTLRDGDVLVVGWGMPVRPGRIALVRLPDGPAGPRGLTVKRVTGRDPGDPQRWWVERDNPREGTDSWLVGGIPDADLPAVVLWRLPRPPVRLARVLGSRAPFGPGRLGYRPAATRRSTGSEGNHRHVRVTPRPHRRRERPL